MFDKGSVSRFFDKNLGYIYGHRGRAGTYGMTILLHGRVKLLLIIQMIRIQFVQFHDVRRVGLFFCCERDGEGVQGLFEQYIELAGRAFFCESY